MAHDLLLLLLLGMTAGLLLHVHPATSHSHSVTSVSHL
jgi:hypothetical protein